MQDKKIILPKNKIPPHLLQYFKHTESRTFKRKGYISHLLQIFDEIQRVLKDEGTLWVNLGDSYCSTGKWGGGNTNDKNVAWGDHRKTSFGIPAKSLCLIPQRFAIAMCERGWILRNEIHWHKSSCMPESVKDRYTRDFEHVFFFTKQPHYFFEQQFEPLKKESIERYKYPMGNCFTPGENYPDEKREHPHQWKQNIHGRNSRTTWDINPEPFAGPHFSTFPTALVERCLLAGCPAQVCSKCGKGRKKIYERGNLVPDAPQYKPRAKGRIDKYIRGIVAAGQEKATPNFHYEQKEIGLTDCGCNAPWVKGIVLDPFMGSGSTAVAAIKLNRDWIGIELSEKYCKLAEKRLSKPIQVRL